MRAMPCSRRCKKSELATEAVPASLPFKKISVVEWLFGFYLRYSMRPTLQVRAINTLTAKIGSPPTYEYDVVLLVPTIYNSDQIMTLTAQLKYPDYAYTSKPVVYRTTPEGVQIPRCQPRRRLAGSFSATSTLKSFAYIDRAATAVLLCFGPIIIYLGQPPFCAMDKALFGRGHHQTLPQ